jgi:hypothetical protein
VDPVSWVLKVAALGRGLLDWEALNIGLWHLVRWGVLGWSIFLVRSPDDQVFRNYELFVFAVSVFD